MKTGSFPLRTPERLPVRIHPCPILDSVLEIRYVSTEDWSVLPGLLYSRVRERYAGKQKNLPLSQVPHEIRRAAPELVYKPLVQFENTEFLIQLGPRVVALLVQPGRYPGWSRLRSEMEWLMGILKEANFIHEAERLGLRYVDFFEIDIFEQLVLEVAVNGERISGTEMSFTQVLHKDSLTCRIEIHNCAFIEKEAKIIKGSLVDLDVWLGPEDFELFDEGLVQFDKAHLLNKQIFFGLLKEEFLLTLSPEYD